MTTVRAIHPETGAHEDAILVRKSGRYAWVRFTTRGPEVRIPATHVIEEDQ